MSCPYEKEKCSGRSATSAVKQNVELSTTGKIVTLRPQEALDTKEVCYYYVAAGLPE